MQQVLIYYINKQIYIYGGKEGKENESQVQGSSLKLWSWLLENILENN